MGARVGWTSKRYYQHGRGRSKQKEKVYPPVVIRAKAGTGKSILVGKTMAELIDAGVDKIRTMANFRQNSILQLKDQTSENLRIAICNVMDGYHKCDSLDQFLNPPPKFHGSENTTHDSFDENSGREDWVYK